MFCKFCGKEIANDSTFCRYCGKKVLEDSIEQNEFEIETESTVQSYDTISDDTVNYSQDISNEQYISVHGNKSADEIVAIFKMVGLALLSCFVYLIGFYIYHQNDIKELKLGSDDSYCGESCYDPHELNDVPEIDPWTIYQHKLFNEQFPGRQYIGFSSGPRNSRSIEVVPEKYKDDPLYVAAVEEANRNKQELLDTLNFHRYEGFREDLKKNAIWSLIISLCFFVIGRYIIKSFKWVNANRTKD